MQITATTTKSHWGREGEEATFDQNLPNSYWLQQNQSGWNGVVDEMLLQVQFAGYFYFNKRLIMLWSDYEKKTLTPLHFSADLFLPTLQ